MSGVLEMLDRLERRFVQTRPPSIDGPVLSPADAQLLRELREALDGASGLIIAYAITDTEQHRRAWERLAEVLL